MSGDEIRLCKPPKPTLLDPYSQIKWMFFLIESEFVEPTAASFRYANNKYIEFVKRTNANYSELENDKRFYLYKYWEADALIRFNKWLSTQDLTSKTRYSIYKTVRKVMDMAYALRIIDTIVYHAPMFKGVSETQQRSAYAMREQEVINSAVAKWLGLTSSVLHGYTPTGEGIPYRRKDYLPPINVDGQSYKISDAAEVFGIEHYLITRRIKMGWTARQSVGLDPSPHASTINFEINGEIYKTRSAITKRFGISEYVFRSRESKGWNLEQIVGLVAPPDNDSSSVNGKPKQIVIDGIAFESIRAASDHFGVKDGLVNHRLSEGWTLREAFGLEKHEYYGTKVTVEGTEYHSISAAADAYGVNHSGVSARLRMGFTPEQAVGVVPIYVSQNDDRALLWRFEHIYGCNAHAMCEDFYSRRSRLTQTCSQQRLLKLFSRWGGWPYIDDRLVMPLAVEMAMLTGLNVESLKLLEVDSLQLEHRLTGQPVISYNKKRSGSSTRSEDRELHLPVLELDELYLEDSVVDRVIRLWGLVMGITSKIRGDASPELSRRLFIFEDVQLSRKNGVRVVVPIDPKGKTKTWYARFSREEGLYDIFGENFNFNLARCRPTLATNMVLAGGDLFQVQVALGHESIQATATYLDEQQLRPAFNKTVSEALASISRRSREFQINSESRSACAVGDDGAGKIGFFETLSGCGCTNPYQPSEHVRAVTKLPVGSICKYWNMCLLCDNAVITENSLPKLIVYRNRVAAALEDNSPALKARKDLYHEVLKLIDGILDSDVIFPATVIERAMCIGATMDDLLVDQLVYQGM